MAIITIVAIDPLFDPDHDAQPEIAFKIPGGDSQAKRLLVYMAEKTGVKLYELPSEPISRKGAARAPKKATRRRKHGS